MSVSVNMYVHRGCVCLHVVHVWEMRIWQNLQARSLSSPHRRGMDTKSLSSTMQSKQHISEKWLYKNTVHDTYLGGGCWCLKSCTTFGVSFDSVNRFQRDMRTVANSSTFSIYFENTIMSQSLVVSDVYQSMNPCNVQVMQAKIERVKLMGQSPSECKQFTSLHHCDLSQQVLSKLQRRLR